ncbi:ATP synthase F1 subunit gamma [Candidatus Peregrinibacteria bacterium RIFOXYB2_FULL_32_7]|nr:MAG: ATP synthase F1 subunit gamma [Candidatus Peregrinibacteria bacterium RIFOXYB2_FULL_32_7]
MQLVAASKMKQFQRKALSARSYAKDLLKILHNNLSDLGKSILTEERESGKILFILYTSDKGLCGALNARMIRGLFDSSKWKNLSKEEKLLITIGKKSYDYARYNKIHVAKSFKSLNENMQAIDALEIVDLIINFWKEQEIKEVIMVSPHYKSPIVFYPVMKTYLPFSEDMIERHVSAEEIAEGKERKKDIFTKEEYMIFEPSKEDFRDALLQQVVQTLFTQSFYELKASEYSSRMMAMQSATDAADEMVDKLTLSLNKARQAIITQEIAEIVGGAMA